MGDIGRTINISVFLGMQVCIICKEHSLILFVLWRKIILDNFDIKQGIGFESGVNYGIFINKTNGRKMGDFC